MKRIAFSCEDNQGMKSELSMHFGRCPFFTLVDVEAGQVLNVTVVENPYFNNHTPGAVPQFINSQQANAMIAGGMGPRAIDLFQGWGIEVATGVGGRVESILEAYLEGMVRGITACAHHDHPHPEGHECR